MVDFIMWSYKVIFEIIIKLLSNLVDLETLKTYSYLEVETITWQKD